MKKERKQICVRVEDNLKEYLKVRAYLEDCSENEVIRRCIISEMKNNPEIVELAEEMREIEQKRKRVQDKIAIENSKGGALEPITNVAVSTQKNTVNRKRTKVFTVDQAAKLLNVSKGTIYKFIKDDSLSNFRLGHRYYIDDERLFN